MNNQNQFGNVDYKEKYNQNNYSRSLYNQNNSYFDDEKKFDEKPKRNVALIAVIAVVILVALGIGIYFLVRGNSDSKELVVNFLVEEMSIEKGESSIISYSLSDSEADLVILYESKNEDIALVNSKGKVYGMKEGSTEIIATYDINGVKNTKTIKVNVTKK